MRVTNCPYLALWQMKEEGEQKEEPTAEEPHMEWGKGPCTCGTSRHGQDQLSHQ